ncbi:hypothetical protein [Streptomyces sp. NPDC058572]|uniref:hypothetical protein n=1 Tax=Streptomyces sp. NPDC058572 TaxID=3346546 RepID=UPI0036497834
MTGTKPERGRAALSQAQKRELKKAKETAERAIVAYRETAGRIGFDLGYGGASAVARHVGRTPAHVSTLVNAYKDKLAARAERNEEAAA